MPHTKAARSRLIAFGWLLINTVTWGAALVVVKPAFEVTTPFRFLLYRFCLAGFLSLPVLIYFLRKKAWPIKTIATIVGLELIGTTLSLSLLYLGLARTSAIEASLITTTTPIFITLFAVFYLKEKQQLHENIGLLIAFVATTALIIIPALHNGASVLTGGSLLGNALVILQNIATAVYFIVAKKQYQKLPKFFVTTISFYVGIVSFGALSIFESWRSGIHLLNSINLDLSSPSVWIAAGYMAIFGSIIGLTAYIKGQAAIEASEASFFWYLQPLVYVPLAVLVLREQISLLQLVLLGGILLGVVVAEKRLW